MRVLSVALVLLAVSLAGCTGDDGGGTTPDPPTSTPPSTGGGGTSGGTSTTPNPDPVTEYNLMTQFTFDDCDGVRFLYLTAPADLQALLPDGYTPAAWPATGQVPLEQLEQGQLGMDVYLCPTFTAGSFAFEDVWFGRVFISVEAPEDAREADAHAYIVEMVAAEDVLAAVWLAAEYPTHNGTATMTDVPGAARTVDIGEYVASVTGAAPGTGGGSGTFAWYHELDTGDRLTWIGSLDIPAGTGGAATLEVPDDSPLASLLAVPGTALEGQGSAIDGASFTGQDLVKELADYRE